MILSAAIMLGMNLRLYRNVGLLHDHDLQLGNYCPVYVNLQVFYVYSYLVQWLGYPQLVVYAHEV